MKRRSRMGQYIRVPLDIETRNETLRMARLLSIPIAEAVCALLRFMIWADLNEDEKRRVCIDPEDLDAITRQPGFSEVAQTMGLIRQVALGADPVLQVLTDLVDEQTFAARKLEMAAEAERKRLARASAGCPPDIRRTSAGHPADVRRGEESRGEAYSEREFSEKKE